MAMPSPGRTPAGEWPGARVAGRKGGALAPQIGETGLAWSGDSHALRVKSGRCSAWQLAPWGAPPPPRLSLRLLTTRGPF